MAKKAKIGKKWQKMAQKWQKLAFFIDFSNFCHIWITFRKIFTETSLTPKMKDFVPVFLLKQSFKSYLKPNLQNWLLKMGQISKNRKKLQKNSKCHKKWENFENSPKTKKNSNFIYFWYFYGFFKLYDQYRPIYGILK